MFSTLLLLLVCSRAATSSDQNAKQCSDDQNTFWFDSGCWPIAPNTYKNNNGSLECTLNSQLINGNCILSGHSQGCSANFLSQQCAGKECKVVLSVFGVPSNCADNVIGNLIRFEEVKEARSSRSIWGFSVQIKRIPFSMIISLRLYLNKQASKPVTIYVSMNPAVFSQQCLRQVTHQTAPIGISLAKSEI